MAEMFLQVRDALIVLLRHADTIAQERVRLGRRIALDNPYAQTTPDQDRMPLCIVSMDTVDFDDNHERGGRVQSTRRAIFHIDCYEAHDYEKARTAGLTADEYLDARLDLFANHVIEVVDSYARFRAASEDVPAPLRLRGQTELRLLDVRKVDIPSEHSVLMGLVTLRVEARYQKDRTLEPTQGILERVEAALRATDEPPEG